MSDIFSKHLKAASAISLLLLAGCFPIRVTDEGRVIDPVRSAPLETNALPVINTGEGTDVQIALEGLGQQRLKVGQCGLFLWARVPERQLVLFSDVATPRATIKSGGQLITLSRSEARGERAMGLYPYQKFSSGDLNVTMNVIVEAREGLTSGAAVPRGTLRLERAGDWEAIIPVAGLIGCQTEQQKRR